MPTGASELSLEALGYLNYLSSVLAQPVDSWEGFYRAQSPSMNFALRYQLAFASYALASLSQHTPAYRAPYVRALRGAIEKMLDVETWGYWHAQPSSSEDGAYVSSGHVAVLLSPHQRGSAGPPSDPIARDNLQYSGHLSTMLGLYEKVSGEHQYDGPFTLHDPASGVAYVYTHSQVAERIHVQMLRNKFGGVCCEPGMAYVPCNNHALASNTLHDALHGTDFRKANAGWLRTVRSKMVLKGPALRGVFGTSYVKDLGVAAPVAFNFTDAWGLAFLLPFDRPLVRRLYGRFRKKISNAGSEGAFVDSSSLSEKLEISDVPINTGFGLVLARGIGDAKLAGALRRYGMTAFDAGWEGNGYLLRSAARTLHATALYALAESIELGGENFADLFNKPSDRAARKDPFLEEVIDAGRVVGVSQAEYNAEERALYITLRQAGDPALVEQAGTVTASLTVANIETKPAIQVDGAQLTEEQYKHSEDGRLRFEVVIKGARPARCVVRTG